MKYTPQQSGFTLVETLVSITILLIVIVGPMTISTTAARSTSFSNEQVVAFFLAQEGLEIAQKGRDDLLLRGFLPAGNSNYVATPWADFVNPSGTFEACYTTSGCALELATDSNGTIKVVSSKVPSCSLNTSSASTPTYILCKLFEYSGGGNTRSHFTYDSGGTSNTASPYERIITFQTVSHNGSNDEVIVTSEVIWRTGEQSQIQKVEVQTSLFNVYGK